MEEEYRKKEGNAKHQILDDKKLELRLAPPRGEFLGSMKSNSLRFEEPAKRLLFNSSWMHGSLESSGFSKEAQVESQGQEKKNLTQMSLIKELRLPLPPDQVLQKKPAGRQHNNFKGGIRIATTTARHQNPKTKRHVREDQHGRRPHW